MSDLVLVAVVTQTDPDVVWIKRPQRREAWPYRVSPSSRARLLTLLARIYPWRFVVDTPLSRGGLMLKEYKVYERERNLRPRQRRAVDK